MKQERKDKVVDVLWCVLIFVVALIVISFAANLLCSCAPHKSAIAPQTDIAARDSMQFRVPWSPNGRPVKFYVLNVEPGIYHGYWAASSITYPFLWGILAERLRVTPITTPHNILLGWRTHPGLVLQMHQQTGAVLPDTACIIEIQNTGGRP